MRPRSKRPSAPPVLYVAGLRESRPRRRVLTAAQSAAELGVSASRIRQLVMRGELRPVARIARDLLFLEKDVARLARERAAPRTPANKRRGAPRRRSTGRNHGRRK